ncbi:MAG: carboxymuconolactone decarboxylase family protein, partial [SAR324 cluster bacterium]|nr:carboxymuconolactone decarboxylase family protein [SAR324 cluster bacterium]
MARIPAATRETIPSNQTAEFDEMISSLGSVPQFGPGSIMIHVPKAHQLATALNQYLRNDSSLPAKVLELSMLVTARENDCMHIWNAHAASARAAGVPGAGVDALRDRKDL